MNEESEINDMLNKTESEENIEILYACETGNWVWGFEDKNCGHKIGFIFTKVNARDYLTLKEERGVFEMYGDGISIVGWDLKKALRQHFKSSPKLREWINSDEVYIDKGIDTIFGDLGGFDREILKNHYLDEALTQWKSYTGLEFREVKIKKYLNVMRCILTWNLLNRGVDPPLNIHKLLSHKYCDVSPVVVSAVNNLLDNLRDVSCKVDEQYILNLNNYILNSFNGMKKVKTTSKKDIKVYDDRFRLLMYR